MKRCAAVLAVALLALLPGPSFAQRRGGFGGGGGLGGFDRSGLFLLSQDSVQKELKLSPDQASQVNNLLEKSRESFGGFRDLSREERRRRMEETAKANEAAVQNILDENQSKRLRQIALQQRGGWALADPKIADELELTADQKDQINSIQEDARNEMRNIAEGGDRQQARERFQALRKSTGQKLEALLTPEQQAKWKALQGEPFAGEIRLGGPGRN
jgi:Spy/CpxP family protein refolding chaperone